MDPIRVFESSPGEFSVWLTAGATDVDEVIAELGHESNGPFWEGVAELLVRNEAPALDGRFECDPEAGAFVAYGEDRQALDELATRMTAVATDARRVRQLVALAEETGFEFDD